MGDCPDIGLVIRYHEPKASRYFLQFTSESLAVVRNDLTALKLPHPKTGNITLVSHGLVQCFWPTALGNVGLHRNLTEKSHPSDATKASLSIATVTLKERGEPKAYFSSPYLSNEPPTSFPSHLKRLHPSSTALARIPTALPTSVNLLKASIAPTGTHVGTDEINSPCPPSKKIKLQQQQMPPSAKPILVPTRNSPFPQRPLNATTAVANGNYAQAATISKANIVSNMSASPIIPRNTPVAQPLVVPAAHQSVALPSSTPSTTSLGTNIAYRPSSLPPRPIAGLPRPPTSSSSLPVTVSSPSANPKNKDLEAANNKASGESSRDAAIKDDNGTPKDRVPLESLSAQAIPAVTLKKDEGSGTAILETQERQKQDTLKPVSNTNVNLTQPDSNLNDDNPDYPPPAAGASEAHARTEQLMNQYWANQRNVTRLVSQQNTIISQLKKLGSGSLPQHFNVISGNSANERLNALKIDFNKELRVKDKTIEDVRCNLESLRSELKNEKRLRIEVEKALASTRCGSTVMECKLNIEKKLHLEAEKSLADARRYTLEARSELEEEKKRVVAMESKLSNETRCRVEAEKIAADLRRDSAGVESQLQNEKRLRIEAEEALADIRRECKDPFVVPSLLEAFLDISKLTTQALNPIDFQYKARE